jgi:hypothetical protein
VGNLFFTREAIYRIFRALPKFRTMSKSSNWNMVDLSPVDAFGAANAYLRWRAARRGAQCFAEKPDQAPAEMLLQRVWLYQRVLGDRLQTIDGRAVKVLHPGFWNREAGPDFKNALVRIGSDPAVSGDIEIDLVPAGWRQHGHAGNPAYRNVVLHVTWEPATTQDDIPSLSLKHALDASLAELTFWLGVEPKPPPDTLAGQCSGPFRALDQQRVRDVVRQAAQARLRGKSEQLLARARQVGWNGALWEGLFSALGYKRNVWPMRRVAELLPLLASELPSASEPAIFLQSRFLGASGMLPAELRQTKTSENYLRQVWDAWWRDADQMREHALPAAIWNFAGIRPVNHPQRRLALAAHWVGRGQLPRQLENWLERTIGKEDLLPSLEQLLQVKHDDFWSYRCTLRSAPGKSARPLLGENRVTDLAINVILPWLYVRAWAGRNHALADAAEARYFHWPSGEDNSVLRLARQRLFGGVSARFQKTAAEQQGVMQIVRDFCDHSNAACENCQFPDLLRSLGELRINVVEIEQSR